MSKAYLYSDEKLQYVSEVKEALVDGCDECGGTGYVSAGRGQAYRCDCMIAFRYIKELIKANVPKSYWTLELAQIKVSKAAKEAVLDYIKHLDNAISRGLGFTFAGPNGVGKTSLMMVLAKEAIIRNIPVRCFTMPEYLAAVERGRVDQIDDYEAGDLLLVDELDKRYSKPGSDYVSTRVDQIIRSFLSAGKSVVIATNWSRQQLKEFSTSVASLLERHNQVIEMKGQDYSKVVEEQFFKRLHTPFDLKHRAIMKAAYRREGIIHG